MQQAFVPELNLFEWPAAQSMVDKSIWIEMNPASTNLNSGLIEFEIVGNEDYVDLSDTVLNLSASIVHGDGNSAIGN